MITLTNTTNSEIQLLGVLFREDGTGDESYQIPAIAMPLWSSNSDVIQNISNGNLLLTSNGVDITNISEAIDILKGITPKQVQSSSFPFADKRLQDGKKVFTRIHGVSGSVQNQPDNIDFTVPYNNCKITGIEIINGDIGDKATFQVLDTPTGTISGVSNYLLNEFGTNVAISKGFYKYKSDYDADLIKDMTLRIQYDAFDSLVAKTVYINFFLHEVKE